jgi:hypothetical protein
MTGTRRHAHRQRRALLPIVQMIFSHIYLIVKTKV